MPVRYERVLITGGSGFIGTYLARTLLAEGRRVVNLDVQAPSAIAAHILGRYGGSYVFEQAGVEDWGALLEVFQRHRPEAVLHGAAIVNVARLRTDPMPAARVNFGGTLNVLEVARLSGVSRVVLISSIGVLPTIQQEPVPPDHPLVLASEGPSSGFYGAAKVASEAFGFAYLRGFGSDFRVVRPSAPYGLGMGWPMFVKTMVEGAVRGSPVRFASGGSYPRAYTYIEDVVDLTIAVLDAPDEADRVFYASAGGPLTTASEVARIVRGLVPGADIEIGDELTEADRFELGIRKRLSIENARRQLGFEPRYGDMRAGIAEYIERFRGYLESVGPNDD
jgi:nucleoside-diphosphate-sugar epimerase